MIAALCPNNLNNNARQMVLLLGNIMMSGGGGFFLASSSAVFLNSLFGRTTATPAPGRGDAGCLSWTTAPHIAHAIEANSFSAKVQVLHRQRLREEEAMV